MLDGCLVYIGLSLGLCGLMVGLLPCFCCIGCGFAFRVCLRLVASWLVWVLFLLVCLGLGFDLLPSWLWLLWFVVLFLGLSSGW